MPAATERSRSSLRVDGVPLEPLPLQWTGTVEHPLPFVATPPEHAIRRQVPEGLRHGARLPDERLPGDQDDAASPRLGVRHGRPEGSRALALMAVPAPAFAGTVSDATTRSGGRSSLVTTTCRGRAALHGWMSFR
jgi:hypothetical protein